jgi:AraC family carnitine catabolism transcriptional activator
MVLASESLRIANQNSGQRLFDWWFASQSGDPVRASNGMWVSVDHDIAQTPDADYLLVLESNLPARKKSRELLGLLRRAHRRGAVVIGVDTGAFALLQAGIGNKDKIVVHWEAQAMLHERFPDIETIDQLYQINETSIFCAGGVATLDLMLELIGNIYDTALAAEVANAFAYKPRNGLDKQRLDYDLATTADPLSQRMLALMETNLNFPLPSDELANQLGVSQRTLDRHCKRHFGHTPMRLYLGIRLQAARNLLFYEDHRVKDVASTYGFSSSAVFCRTFRAYFGQTPKQFRDAFRAQQTGIRLPEIRRLYTAREKY